jgi:hypothetical protein
VASFSGDSNYSSSTSSDTPVTVSKQSQITGTLQYLDDPSYAFPANFTINIPAPIRIKLSGPAGGFPTSSNFPPSALENRKVLVTLTNDYSKTNCLIATSSQVVDKSDGVYEVTITQKVIPDPGDASLYTYDIAADFSVTCSVESTLGLSLEVVFSDKTTPTKDSDDFGFSAPVSLTQKPVSKPSLGTMTITIKRKDTANTNMLTNSTTIGKLHFGQNYNVAVTGSSNIQVPYDYTYNRTYTERWIFGWYYYSVSNSSNPVTLSQNDRNAIKTSYDSNAKWTVDPANFLTGADFGTGGGNTCISNMTLTTTLGTFGESSSYSLTSVNYYWSGGVYYRDITYLVSVYGKQNLTLGSPAGCTLTFEGATTNTPIPNAIITTPGTIAVSALSGDDRFAVNYIYNVTGIDKQTATMTYNPSTAQTGYVSINIPFGISLSPGTDIVGGTSLPFVDTAQNFSTYFSPSSPLDSTCPNLLLAGSSLNPINVTFTSSTTATSCTPKIKYIGNKYYYGTDKNYTSTSGYVALPAMTFNKHNSSVAFTAALPFASSGAFLETTYNSMKVRVSDGESHGASSSPTPGGSVNLQVYKSDGVTAYTCSDFTLTITPAVTCASGTYTLPLSGGETTTFSLLFKSATVASGNIIKLAYSGDSSFNTSNSSSAGFTVKKHASSLNTVQYQQGQTWTTLAPTFPTMKVGQSMDMRVLVSDGDGLSHTVIPTGILEVWMVDSASVTLDPLAATNPIYSVTLVSGTTYDSTNKLYKVTLDSSGYASFTLNFRFAAANLSLKYRYAGDTLFNASSTSTTGPLAFTN